MCVAPGPVTTSIDGSHFSIVMFSRRSAFVWALFSSTTLVWRQDGCSASLSWVGKNDLESFQYNDDAAMIEAQDFRVALDECVAGDHRCSRRVAS